MGMSPEGMMYDRDDEGKVWLRIPIVGETRKRLDDIARMAGEEPETLAASMLHDLLEDDEFYNADECAPADKRLIN
jgi:hypothetical protein